MYWFFSWLQFGSLVCMLFICFTLAPSAYVHLSVVEMLLFLFPFLLVWRDSLFISSIRLRLVHTSFFSSSSFSKQFQQTQKTWIISNIVSCKCFWLQWKNLKKNTATNKSFLSQQFQFWTHMNYMGSSFYDIISHGIFKAPIKQCKSNPNSDSLAFFFLEWTSTLDGPLCTETLTQRLINFLLIDNFERCEQCKKKVRKTNIK